VSEPTHTLDELEKHSAMLGQICGVVDEFCDHEDCTTLDAVRLMKAEIYELRAYKMRNEVWKKYSD
jgi:hypothetical protein